MNKKSALLAITFSLYAALCIGAESPTSTVLLPSTKPLSFALVSALGDQFTYVRQKEATGSNIIDNNIRQVIKVPNNGLNAAVLRGLDLTIARAHPTSERIYLSLNPVELEGVLPQNREEVALGKITAQLEKMPERAKWDRIIVATPKFLFSQREGMGPKLQGLGVYIQPLESAKISGTDDSGAGYDIDASGQGESDTISPDGKRSSSKLYVAPYSYIQVYVIDAKTMTILEKNARHDFTKIYDPTSTTIDVGRSIPPDVIATRMVSLIERSVAKALGDTEAGTRVDIGDIVPVANQPGAPTKK